MTKTAIGWMTWLTATGAAALIATGLDWTPDGAMKGIEVTASEWVEVTHRGATFRCSELLAPGAPDGVRYKLWQRWLDGAEQPLEATIRVSSGGLLVDAADGSPILSCLGDFQPGEPLLVALISEDRQTRVLGTLTPFPLEAAGGPAACRLSLRRVNSEGTAFFARAEGFAAGESLETEARSGSDRRLQSTVANETGTLVAYLQPQVAGRKGGRATYSVTGAQCSVTIEYDWGRSPRRR